MTARPQPLLSIRDLSIAIRTDEGTAEVLDRASLEIARGEIVGVVGESGCGKSTLVKSVLGILPPAARVTAGAITFDGIELTTLDAKTLTRDIRGRRIGFIPQDPYQAFNPVFTVGTQLLEVAKWHGGDGGRADRARLVALLRTVQIPDAERALDRYPHQFSGGQRQRLLIAASLLCAPDLIIADEPTTALDVTTQRQIIALLGGLARDSGTAMLFVTHDFGVVAQLCDRVAVMYAGQTVERGRSAVILEAPRHPYTRLLLDCHPDRATTLAGIPGSVPSVIAAPAGCRFHPRCPSARPDCSAAPPRTVALAADHEAACVLFA
ncbi:MAG: ABC transporter ATP-binding protein [Alphaproteobacteria bacterium]|nr:ABC transporter ATP-binding protein [Alphaproteobacteria bacterium]